MNTGPIDGMQPNLAVYVYMGREPYTYKRVLSTSTGKKPTIAFASQLSYV